MRIEGLLILKAQEDDSSERPGWQNEPSFYVKSVVELGTIEANQPELDRLARFARRKVREWLANKGQVFVEPETDSLVSNEWRIPESLVYRLADELRAAAGFYQEYEDREDRGIRDTLEAFDLWEKEMIG